MTHPPQVLTPPLGCPPGKKVSSYFQPQTPMFHLCCCPSLSCHATLKSLSTSSVSRPISAGCVVGAPGAILYPKASSQRTRAPAPPSVTRIVTVPLKPLQFAGVSSVLWAATGGGAQSGADKHQAEGMDPAVSCLSPVSSSHHPRLLWPSLLPRHVDIPAQPINTQDHIPELPLHPLFQAEQEWPCTDPEEPCLILAHHPARSSPASLSSLPHSNVTAQLQQPG